MMFSSNQKIAVSGPLEIEYIVEVLKFALRYSGEATQFSNNDKEEILTYQITEKGNFCVGWGVDEVPEGWELFDFDFDYYKVANLIQEQIDTQEIEFEYTGDGEVEKGFLMQDMSNVYEAENRGIKNPNYGIVEFIPYEVYYAK